MLKRLLRRIFKLEEQNDMIHELRNIRTKEILKQGREAKTERVNAEHRREVTYQIAVTTGGKRRGL